MGDSKPTVVVTGISGNLGTRLLPQLSDFNVIGIDITPPVTDLPVRFERLDLGEEEFLPGIISSAARFRRLRGRAPRFRARSGSHRRA